MKLAHGISSLLLAAVFCSSVAGAADVRGLGDGWNQVPADAAPTTPSADAQAATLKAKLAQEKAEVEALSAQLQDAKISRDGVVLITLTALGAAGISYLAYRFEPVVALRVFGKTGTLITTGVISVGGLEMYVTEAQAQQLQDQLTAAKARIEQDEKALD
jgi:hypothetical protein